MAPKKAPQPPSVPANRKDLLLALANMPDEAFGWFVVWANGQMTQYPAGLGGFSPESQRTIKLLRKAAKKFLES